MLNTESQPVIAKILVVSVMILAIGMVMVSSSSMAFSDYGYDGVFYHTRAHLIRVLLGISAALVVFALGVRAFKKFSLPLIISSLVLSLMIFVPSMSVEVNGAVRWLKLGPVVFQPYDLFKLGYIVFFAHVLEIYHLSGNKRGLYFCYAMIGVASISLLLQPDFGSLSLLVAVLLITVFLAKGMSRYYIAIFLLFMVAGMWLIISEPYRMERVATLFNPWSDRYGSGFQLVQALIAEGSGGASGVGLGQSIQKMLYLPEAHTDFTISVLAEEVGMLGVLFIISLLSYLYYLMMQASHNLNSNGCLFESYVVFISANFIYIQSLVNIGVNYGLLPTKGITLPFMGYGGTSIVSHIIMVGMVLSCIRSLSSSIKPIDGSHFKHHRSAVLTVS